MEREEVLGGPTPFDAVWREAGQRLTRRIPQMEDLPSYLSILDHKWGIVVTRWC